jgi:hypothetical protein
MTKSIQSKTKTAVTGNAKLLPQTDHQAGIAAKLGVI